MNDQEFRVLLDLRMVSDPWPLDEEDDEIFGQLLERESERRGYETWVHAYHEFDATPPDPPDGVSIRSWGSEREFVEVEFPNGVRYQFLDVPPQVQKEWLAGDTAQYYMDNIRGEYRYIRVAG